MLFFFYIILKLSNLGKSKQVAKRFAAIENPWVSHHSYFIDIIITITFLFIFLDFYIIFSMADQILTESPRYPIFAMTIKLRMECLRYWYILKKKKKLRETLVLLDSISFLSKRLSMGFLISHFLQISTFFITYQNCF